MELTYTLAGLTITDIASLRIAIKDRCDALETEIESLEALDRHVKDVCRPVLLGALVSLKGISRKLDESIDKGPE